MPSALETLVKILKLEREQGCKNSAVIGGLSAYSEKWAQEAHNQARKPEHHALVSELSELMRTYELIQNKTERHKSITYMLDRITGRARPAGEIQIPAESALPAALEAAPPLPAAPVSEPQADASRQASEKSEAGLAQPRAERQPREPRAQTRRRDEPRESKDEPKQRHDEQKPRREKDKPRKEQRPPQSQPNQRKPQRAARNGDEDEDLFPDVPEAADEPMFDAFDRPARGPQGGGSRQVAELDIRPQPRLARPPRRPRPALDPQAAADIMRGLQAPVTVVKGVGPGMATLLGKLGIQTVNDLLFYLPRRYDDYTRLRNISQLQPDVVATVIGVVAHTEVRVGRGQRRDFFLVLDDGSARMGVTFFGQHFLARAIKVGQQLVLSGTTSVYGHRIQMTNPEWEHLDTENLHTVGIVPVYGLTEGLSGRALRKLMKKTVTYWAERLPDYMPAGTLERADLADLGWTISNLHFPEGWDHLQHARNRFIFDELLLLQLAILGNRRDWQSVSSQPLTVSDDFLNSFIETVFPYPLTGAQRRAIDDIRHDVQRTTPMNRLLQGDVGSGKTAVATVALAMALVNGKQAALMAPTSILAEQHYRSVGAMLERMPAERRPVVALLTSALTTTEREAIYRGIADGSIDVVIGTHALIQEGVEFHDLGVAIIDEQHRFGVEQRKALRGKGTNPHLLVMTATPIPRTLALTMYADLDLSVIDEMPPGRIPIQTRVIDPVARERVYNFVESEMNKGRQAFVVHPLVEASEKIEAPAAVEAYERLQKVFFHHKVGLLHGRMKPSEKDEVMAAFASGKFDVLVTTSVAEVGVNIPNATVIVIEGANRFGLAQLHQFRGRVGRGEHASYCLLLSDTNAPEARERLRALEEISDGFKLAEIDWKLRGAGDLVGTRQSGGSQIQLAQEMTPQLVELAQREARTIYEEDRDLSQPQHQLLAERVAMLHNERSDVS